MSDLDSSTSIIKLLFDLSTSYLGSYRNLVTGTADSIENRQRAGNMMKNFRLLACVMRSALDTKFNDVYSELT